MYLYILLLENCECLRIGLKKTKKNGHRKGIHSYIEMLIAKCNRKFNLR
jgi:hypothetical protein